MSNLQLNSGEYVDKCLGNRLNTDMMRVGLSALYDIDKELGDEIVYSAIRGSTSRGYSGPWDDVDLLLGANRTDIDFKRVIETICKDYGSTLKRMHPEMKRKSQLMVTYILMDPNKYRGFKEDPLALDICYNNAEPELGKHNHHVLRGADRFLNESRILTNFSDDPIAFINDRLFGQLAYNIMPEDVRAGWERKIGEERKKKLQKKYERKISLALTYTLARLSHVLFRGDDIQTHDIVQKRNKKIFAEFPDGRLRKV